MTDVRDLADLIIARRAHAQRALESELVRLRVTYGHRAIEAALRIAQDAELRDRMSISAQRQRRAQEKAAALGAESLPNENPGCELPAVDMSLVPPPTGWR